MARLLSSRDSTNRKDDLPDVRGDRLPSGPTLSSTSASILPHRIEFHLSRKSSLSFSGSNTKPLNSSSEPSKAFLSPFENDINPDFNFHMPVRRIGAGLDNLGNTCFLNSVLQCLTYTEPLVAYLQRGKHQNLCRVVGFCSLCAMQKHVTRTLEATGKVLAPKEIVSNLRCISRNFQNGRQEDAHEYMVHLLESMHKSCLPSGVPSASSGAYEKSFVHKIFGGCLRSQVKCMQCSHCSNKSDPFIDLSLEIVKADSLQKALVHFTAQEQLDGGERRYQCQHCKKKVQALKQLTIEKAPYVLIIHLKRFGSHISGQKIDKKVQFGPTLNLKPFVSDAYDGDVSYKLYGVLVHAGWSTHSGHYYCFVRASSGMWYSLNDSRVVQVSEKTVMEQKAYMLFYVRDVKTSVSKNINTSTQYGPSPISSISQISEKRPTDEPANGSLAIQSVSPGSVKGEKYTKEKFQENVATKKCNSSTNIDEAAIMHPCKSSTYEDKISKMNLLVSPAKPSECPAEALEIVPGIFDKDGNAFEEPVPKTKADVKSGNAFSISSRKKSKKIVRVASTHLSTRKLLYMASINMQKKKKHKKVKRENQTVAAMNVDEPMEPSSSSHVTSATVASTIGSKCSVRKREADEAKCDMASTGISVAESRDLELEKRIASGDAMPTSDEQTLKSLKTPAAITLQSERQPSGLNGKVNIGNGISVGRWDDIDLEPSHAIDSYKTNNVSIGYVPDEWDEEYDRGKRKKIRTTKVEFGGPNPFQVVSTKAAAKSKHRNKHLNIVNETLNL